MTWNIQRLGPSDIDHMRALNALFAQAFEDDATYTARPPDEAYLATQLANPSILVLTAICRDDVVGGLVAYVLPKLEQARSEIYIYDLAVRGDQRRKGVATGLIKDLRSRATELGAWVVYVQADYADPPAIALYTKLGTREEVLHFDIAPDNPA